MKILILGAGWYGCHLAAALQGDHDVLLQEKSTRPFNGASGANPARLHIGPHYPRSKKTRQACQRHTSQFMAQYGNLTRSIAQNIYAIAEEDSLVDLGTYEQILRQEISFLTVADPREIGLQCVEGAIQVSERHVIIEEARRYFADKLQPVLHYGAEDFSSWPDLTIDCTFCTHSSKGVDRYEPCLTVILEGPTDTAITIMDGPFPSLYPWDEQNKWCSLTSAKYTPLDRVETSAEAHQILKRTTTGTVDARAFCMVQQMAKYYPRILDTHKVVDKLLSVRAMPKSAADARLVEVVQDGEKMLRVRAGKIDAVFEAEARVRAFIGILG